jgi:hypothetical protein
MDPLSGMERKCLHADSVQRSVKVGDFITHNNVLYYFPAAMNVGLTTKDQVGSGTGSTVPVPKMLYMERSSSFGLIMLLLQTMRAMLILLCLVPKLLIQKQCSS